jgi:hypothetical protein
LYPILLRWWMDVLGEGPATTRGLSVLFDLGAIAVFFDVCRFLHGSRIALLACAIMALSIGQIDFAQETRSYALLILLGLCCCDLLVRLQMLGSSRRRWIMLTTALVATALTHYIALGALAALGVYAICQLRGEARRQALLAFVLAAAVAGILWGPWLGRQIHTLPSTHPEYLSESHSHHARATLLRLVGIPGRQICGDLAARRLPAWTFMLLAALIVAIPAVRFRRANLLLWVLWLAGTVGMLAVVDLVRGSILLEYLRYSILAGPAVYAILAAVAWPPRPLLRDGVAWCTLALLTVLVSHRLRDGVASREDWRQLAADLNAHAAPDDLLVFYGGDPWISPGTWYMCFMYYTPQSHRAWLILHRPADARLLRELASRNSLWLIGKYPQEDGPALLPGWQPQSILRNPTAGAICRMVRVIPPHP